jgi:hypothetical protein
MASQPKNDNMIFWTNCYLDRAFVRFKTCEAHVFQELDTVLTSYSGPLRDRIAAHRPNRGMFEVIIVTKTTQQPNRGGG